MSRNLDLGPNEYRKQDPSGAWYAPDDWRALVIGLVVCIAALGYLYWRRGEMDGHPGLLMGVTAMFAGSGGMLLALLIKLRGY